MQVLFVCSIHRGGLLVELRGMFLGTGARGTLKKSCPMLIRSMHGIEHYLS